MWTNFADVEAAIYADDQAAFGLRLHQFIKDNPGPFQILNYVPPGILIRCYLEHTKTLHMEAAPAPPGSLLFPCDDFYSVDVGEGRKRRNGLERAPSQQALAFFYAQGYRRDPNVRGTRSKLLLLDLVMVGDLTETRTFRLENRIQLTDEMFDKLRGI